MRAIGKLPVRLVPSMRSTQGSHDRQAHVSSRSRLKLRHDQPRGFFIGSKRINERDLLSLTDTHTKLEIPLQNITSVTSTYSPPPLMIHSSRTGGCFDYVLKIFNQQLTVAQILDVGIYGT